MKIGIIGSGMVAQTIGSKLVSLGHEVKLGSRDPQKLAEWHSKAGPGASTGSFADAAAFGGLLFNCTAGTGSLDALGEAGEQNLNGKVLVDVSNPLDFSQGMPPFLSVCNTDSVAEQLQRAYPQLKVVKSLNTVTADVMVNPALVAGGDHDIFVSGNDAEAKATVTNLLKEQFGWHNVVDLGDLTSARATEMYVTLWLRLYGMLQTPNFNIKIVR